MSPSGFDAPPPAGADAPAPRVRATRAKLKTCGDVSRELAGLYRQCKSGKLDTASGSRMANMLAILARIISDSDLEARIEALEAKGQR